MKYLIRGILTGSLLIGCSAALAEEAEAPAPPFSFSGNIALTTDYRFRGISQTDEDPAVQGGFNLNHESGFYAGVWASNLDFNDGDQASIEIDVFGGYSAKFNDDLGYDLGFITYIYPGADTASDYDYTEVYAGLTYKVFSLKYYYSPEFFFETGDAGYIDATANLSLPADFGLLLHAGHQSIDENANFGTPDYLDYRIGVNKKLAGFGFDLSYIDTNIDDDECFAGTANTDFCDGTVVFTVSRSL